MNLIIWYVYNVWTPSVHWCRQIIQALNRHRSRTHGKLIAVYWRRSLWPYAVWNNGNQNKLLILSLSSTEMVVNTNIYSGRSGILPRPMLTVWTYLDFKTNVRVGKGFTCIASLILLVVFFNVICVLFLILHLYLHVCIGDKCFEVSI